MREWYDTIVLSPHLDDAALSCGGQILQETAVGKTVLIVTFMAGDPPLNLSSGLVAALHTKWALQQDVVAARRAEDVAASRILGADYWHGSLHDAPYRDLAGAPFYEENHELFGAVHPIDRENVLPAMANILVHLPPAGRMVAPLALGNHVDHQLVREAAWAYRGRTLQFYEDYPYARLPGALERVIPADRMNWYSESVQLDEETVAKKADAIWAFVSQMSSFFNGRQDLVQQLQEQAAKVGGERRWRYAQADYPWQ